MTQKIADQPFTLEITPAAIEGARKLITKYDMDAATAGLRVGAYSGGCSGYMYDVRVEKAPESDDEVLLIDGLRVFVNGFSKELVSGMTVDWVSNMVEQRFVFKNPNATGSCGCGESFSA